MPLLMILLLLRPAIPLSAWRRSRPALHVCARLLLTRNVPRPARLHAQPSSAVRLLVLFGESCPARSAYRRTPAVLRPGRHRYTRSRVGT
ncbi:uncharacterized protein PHACADRAFT_250158 [Phanerochaete carnosa HHB-10118-sp]|uniref:Secreted protein n=1 Tax=Phanerochaete carnosa (strain HHB-10118-sp) TaxID=650164 RepID=K5WJI0_PHACS|nr:uncharacterized protein PHACADRAFT_250158 [Phanerochaete carnosa HHB-10118-sp]EKM59565.1 hypothetical protein PHACADRAFT_250158 [Phanerochaete carnosa HHB-10118-sp]